MDNNIDAFLAKIASGEDTTPSDVTVSVPSFDNSTQYLSEKDNSLLYELSHSNINHKTNE